MSKFRMLNTCLILIDEGGEETSTGVTLITNGIMISGDLINPLAYFKAVTESLNSATGDNFSRTVAQRIGKAISESLEKAIESPDQSQEDAQNTERDEIYLKNIKILYSPTPVTINNAVIALRVDAIDGFIWGKI
jgi:hypothetical protein